MWQHASKGFEILLSSRIYPTLLDCPDYCQLLQTCGITRPFPHDIAQLSPTQRNLLAQNAQVRANLLMLEFQQLDALRQTNANALQLEGHKYRHLYRLWNSQVKTSELRFFWFTEELLLESFRQAGKKVKDRLEWLRRQMAVAYNWSLCDKVAQLRLGPGDVILGIQAEGLPMRGITVRPGEQEVRLPTDYWTNFDKYAKQLPGGAPQLFLFLVPRSLVRSYW